MRFPFLIAMLVIAPALHAQKVTLTAFPADGTFAVVAEQEMAMVMSVASPDSAVQAEADEVRQEVALRQTTDATLTVERHGATTHISAVNDRVRMSIESPGQGGMSYDSDAPEEGGFPAAAQQAVWVGKPIEFRIVGDSVSIVDIDSLIQTVIRVGDAEWQQLQREAFTDLFKQMLGNGLFALPKTPVGAGDTFDVDMSVPLAGMGAMRMTGTWTVRNVEGTRATFGGPFTVTGEMAGLGLPTLLEMSGSGRYDATMDTTSGEQENRTDMQMEATMDLGALSGGQAEGTMKMSATMVQVQTMSRR